LPLAVGGQRSVLIRAGLQQPVEQGFSNRWSRA
jgi:hypothetical protein